MHYIKEIFQNNINEHAHNKFIRYSKGDFTGALIDIKVSKKAIKVNASFHLADEILNLFAEYLGDEQIHAKGLLSWNADLNPELESAGIKYLKVSKARGIFNYKLDNDIKLDSFMKTMGKYNILLSFKGDDYKVTMKPKFPKPNKEIGADFIKSIFPISMKNRIMEEFGFDIKSDFKDASIKHRYIVEDIEYPKEEGISFEEIRKRSKRCTKIIRTVKVDSNDEIVTEIEAKI